MSLAYWCFCCCCSVVVSNSLWPRDCSSPGSPVLHYLLEFAQFTSTEPVMPSNHLLLCLPLLLWPSIFPSIRVLSNESALHIRWPKYWSFSFSNSPSNEYSLSPQVMSCCRGWSVCWGASNSIPSLYPLDAKIASPIQTWWAKMSSDSAHVPGHRENRDPK